MKPSCCPRHLEAETERLFVARDSVSGDRFEIVTCVQCGLARTDPQPAPDELGRYYPSGYHGVTKRYRLRLDRSLSVLHRARIRRIERLAGGPGRVVDIGCGPGWFLESMRRRGWQTRG